MKLIPGLKQFPLILLALSLTACNSGESTSDYNPSLKDGSYTPNFVPTNSTEVPTTDGISSVTATLLAGESNSHPVTITKYGTATLYTTSYLDTVCSLTDANHVELANDDDSGTDLNCSLTADLSPGTYYFVVWGYSSDVSGNYTASLDFTPISSTEFEPNNTVAEADIYNSMDLETKTGIVDTTTDTYDIFAFTPLVSGNYRTTLSGFAGDLDLFIMDSFGTTLTGSYTSATGGSETLSYYMQAGQTYYITADAWNAQNDGYSLTLASLMTQSATPETEPNNSTTEANPVYIGNVAGVVDSVYDYADTFVFTPSVTDTYSIVISGFNGDLDLKVSDFAGFVVYSNITRAYGGTETVTYTLQAGQPYYITVEGWSATDDSYNLSIETTTTAAPVASTEVEVNDTIASANVVGIGTVSGMVDTAGEPNDVFAFTPTMSGGYNMTLTGFAGDLDLYLTDAAEQTLTSSRSATLGGSETVMWYLQAGETYYLRVYAWSAANDSYSLTVAAQ